MPLRRCRTLTISDRMSSPRCQPTSLALIRSEVAAARMTSLAEPFERWIAGPAVSGAHPTVKDTECHPVAPSGMTSASAEVCVAPVLSVARTVI